MTDRPQPDPRRPSRRPRPRPAAEPEPDLIVIPPEHGPSAKFLPPILIVLAGTAFLGYRSSVADWRTPARSPRTTAAARRTKALALAGPVSAKPLDPPVPAPVPLPAVAQQDPPPLPGPNLAPIPAPAAPDVMGDIVREAALTRAKLAELERVKKEAADHLEATARERHIAAGAKIQAKRLKARNARRARPSESALMARLLRQEAAMARNAGFQAPSGWGGFPWGNMSGPAYLGSIRGLSGPAFGFGSPVYQGIPFAMPTQGFGMPAFHGAMGGVGHHMR